MAASEILSKKIQMIFFSVTDSTDPGMMLNYQAKLFYHLNWGSGIQTAWQELTWSCYLLCSLGIEWRMTHPRKKHSDFYNNLHKHSSP